MSSESKRGFTMLRFDARALREHADRRSIACRAHDAPQHTKIPSLRRLSLESVVVESKTRICTGVEASRHQYRSLSLHGSSFTGGERARITSRCRPRRAS
ncbi:hypothetical protein EMIT0158MI4_20226 [Burkholderia ambifaria]